MFSCLESSALDIAGLFLIKIVKASGMSLERRYFCHFAKSTLKSSS